MIFKSVIIGITVSTLMVSGTDDPDNLIFPGYTTRNASGKQQQLWNYLQRSEGRSVTWASPQTWFQMLQADLSFIFRNNRASNGREIDTDIRPWSGNKVVHPIGYVGLAKFVPAQNKFTGIFETGAEHALIRMSLNGPPESGIRPSIACKFFRNNVPSANLVANMWLPTQNSDNWFAHEFSNHVEPTNGIETEKVGRKFSQVDDWRTLTGLSDIARFGNDGNQVQSIDFPFEVRLKPRGPLVNQGFTQENLHEIPSGTVLYDLWGRDSPHDCPDDPETMYRSFHYLGRIETTSKMIKSLAGDKTLFFRHQSFGEDLNLRPQWQRHIPQGFDW
eukprot:CAMPEP_0195538516 /NCGR_PEP_ID=MMETSP0794_2-20130614/49572_1 /TAXON_ID=515487 /ORGANISM="Stephanopyxis turris, Strain CCMP 815" /LENGTH=331 /DNA_ID=CAMNT_0040672505 /DNA_START=221 /DNA_END=1213 /DNA_ORIENTATION=-